MSGRLIGVGVGPGDPDLITLKAVRALAGADVVAYFAKAGNGSHARAIAAAHFPPGAEEMPLLYPVTTELPRHDPAYRDALCGFYEEASVRIAERLAAGRTVAVLSEGDPLFYGSYMHLHVRLSGRFPAEVIAGVTGMSGCWSTVGMPIAQGDDVLMVLPGTLSEAELARRLAEADAAVIMKVGRNLPKIRRALAAAGRLPRAYYVERGTMVGCTAIPLSARDEAPAPYFAIVLVPGWERTA
ncbi:precorrin-2 C(20)-methyltransferase [Aquabacter spiritensis]|uniref:Precorrin-2/cobalt-factor-2 C20-methyltransferase n=1 Tax=Aquabacter spiritensis TaxID=933073 RepID=A0A4R3M4G0_9HYPH|nr:precorrin-2 C(20)-methyltransferase [Aquabacter spiritensis]TCT08120.1 precorrin-2/cobalt-factor-2 C20-methyltransferase [Aquabacter spiritensis]